MAFTNSKPRVGPSGRPLPGPPAARAAPSGGAAGGGSLRRARPLAPRAPPRVLCPAGWRRRAAPRERGAPLLGVSSDPAPCPRRFGAAKALSRQLPSLQKSKRKRRRFRGAGSQRARPPSAASPQRVPARRACVPGGGPRRAPAPGGTARGSRRSRAARGGGGELTARLQAASAGARGAEAGDSALRPAADSAEGERDPGGRQSPMSGGNAQPVGRPGDNAQIWGKLGAMPSRFPGRGRRSADVLADAESGQVCLRTQKFCKCEGLRDFPGGHGEARGQGPPCAGLGAAESGGRPKDDARNQGRVGALSDLQAERMSVLK